MFRKQPNPTFRAIAAINRPGDDPGLIDFEFRHVGRKDWDALMKSIADKQIGEAEGLAQLVAGWNEAHPESMVAAPFSVDALRTLLDDYWSAGSAIIEAYSRAHFEAKRKN